MNARPHMYACFGIATLSACQGDAHWHQPVQRSQTVIVASAQRMRTAESMPAPSLYWTLSFRTDARSTHATSTSPAL